MEHFDVIILGGGVAGAVLLDALAERGRRAVLFTERETSSGPEPLQTWDSDWRIARLAAASLPIYRALPCHFVRTGALTVLDRPDLVALREQVGGLNAAGAELAILSPARLRQRFPDREWRPSDFAIYEERAGTACRVTAGCSWKARAHRSGAMTVEGARIDEVARRDGCVAGVVADGRPYHASRIAQLDIDDKLDGASSFEFSPKLAGLLHVRVGRAPLFRIAPALAQRAALLLGGDR